MKQNKYKGEQKKMVEVKVNIVPFGFKDLKKEIGSMKIINDGTHKKRPEYGNYVIKIDDKEIKITDHKRSDGIWVLIKRALEELKT